MNTRPILLTYATRYGSTQEVAEAIAAELRAAGLGVETQPMRGVESLDNYDAVILGAAIYNARWHPDAQAFVSRHEEALKRRPVAIFALGPISTSNAGMNRSRRQLDKELAQYPWLQPIAVEMFVGKMGPAKLSFFNRFGSRAIDKRDWNAIRAWANTLPALLQPEGILQPA